MTELKGIESDALERIQRAASARGKHTDYQRLPDFLPQHVKDCIPVTSMHLEKERLDWMLERVDFREKRVIEIGANSGYFSLMLARTQKARVDAYEPFPAHAEFTRVLAQVCGLQTAVSVHEEPVTLESISRLPTVDVLIFLNVIHHAGFDFDDGSHATDKEQWWRFASDYLSRLKAVSDIMVFQMGYTLGGVAGRLCRDPDIHHFTRRLLQQSGWRILHHGAIRSLPVNTAKLSYSDVSSDDKVRTISNTRLHRLAANAVSRLTGRAQLTTRRFAQRPMFICEAR